MCTTYQQVVEAIKVACVDRREAIAEVESEFMERQLAAQKACAAIGHIFGRNQLPVGTRMCVCCHVLELHSEAEGAPAIPVEGVANV